MKPRGIWIIIALILVTGIETTAYIREYTQNTELMEIRQAEIFHESAAAPVSEAEETQNEGIAMARILPGEPEKPAEPEEKEEFGAETVSEPVSEPAAGAPAMARAVPAPAVLRAAEDGAAEPEAETESSVILDRLNDLDEQIAKSQSQKSGDTTNSQKAASETARKLWEAELSRFLDVLESELDKEEKDALMKEQNEWIRQRENKALEVSGKQNGSVRQELEYTISMTESTRSRVYELAQEYEELLSEAEK